MIEFDEAYFEKATPEKIKLKRGKGSQKQQNVAVMAESTFLENLESKTKSKHCGYFKMQVLDSHKTNEINEVVKDNIDERSIVFSDKANTYLNISEYVDMHFTEKSTNKTTATTLKWVHIAINLSSIFNIVSFVQSLRSRILEVFSKGEFPLGEEG